MQILTVKTSFYKNETIIFGISTPENMGFKKKSPVYLKGKAVQSRNHSSVTIKFKFIKKLKRLPFGNPLTDFVQIFFVSCYFWSSFKWAHFHHILWGWVNKGVQVSMEWPPSLSDETIKYMNSWIYILILHPRSNRVQHLKTVCRQISQMTNIPADVISWVG